MYKYALIILLISVSCSSKDEQFCECLSAGEAFNIETQKVFDTAPTAEEQTKIEALKEKKTEACEKYTTMSGDEMRKLKEGCEN